MRAPILPTDDYPVLPPESRPDPDVAAVSIEPSAQVSRTEVLSVVEEQLRIEKRTVEGEGVRVRVLTEEAQAPANTILRVERIEVEHVPIGRVVERAPPVREEDGVTIIPVMEEVVVTETRLVLKEELHVRRVVEMREHQQTVLLRRQRAEVERLPAAGRPVNNVADATPMKED